MSPSLVWISLALYGLGGLALAFYARRGLREGAEEFYLAGRSMSGLISAASYAATTYSAFMMLGLAGLTYRGGVGALGFELVYFAGLGLLLIFGPRFWIVGRKFGFLTPSEMLGRRYESPLLAGVVAVLSCVFLVPYCSVQLLGIGYLLSGTIGEGVPVSAGILIGAVLAAAWTLGAGLRSVAWTDALQAIVILISAALAVGAVVGALGGWGVFLSRIEAERGAWLTQPGPGTFSFSTFVGLTVPWFFFAISNPQVSQRLFATRDLGAMRTMVIGVLIFGLLFTVISVLWGFAALLMVPDLENPDLATPSLIGSGAMPPAIAVPLLIGIVAAAVTTVDSVALTLASMIGRDVHRASGRFGAQGELAVGKAVIVLVIGAAAAFAHLQLDLISLLSVASSTGLVMIVPAIVGAFFWSRGTAAGALSSVLGGTAAVVILTVAGWNPLGIPASLLAFAICIALFIGVSLVSRPPADRGRGFMGEIQPILTRLGAD